MQKMSELSHKVFMDRYALKDREGNALENTPEEMWKRVARGLAKVEKGTNRKKWEKEFSRVMQDFKFVPGGRILSGAGTNFQVTYFNCFVIPSPKDSRGEIIETLKQMVEIMARGGGVGFNISSLRPRGARVKKVNGFSSGPINWAELFSVATKDIVQQAGTRRGALMLMLHDWHPDVEEFITVKEDLSKINGANLSVCVSDDFMEAVKKDADWALMYPDLDDPMYDSKWDGDLETWKKLGGKVKVYKTVKAKYLWDLICTAAWKSAEPGLHFLDRSNKRSNTWYFERLIATNPCGEQPLGPWAVCNLGSMNLAAYVENKEFDFENFAKDVRVAIRLMDNVIDETYYFLKENEKCAKDIRRTGLGIMGLGDALIKMEVRYGSEESLPLIDKIFKTLRDNAYEASSDIAKEKGSFPLYNREKYLKGYHIQALPEKIREKIKKQGIRNAVLLTVAPTGTTSLVSGVSSGIEPVYEFEFIRRDRLGEHRVYHPLFDEWRKDHPNDSRPDYFVSANDLTPLEHVKVQAIAQEYIDSSISKTVNAPKTHTVEDVQNLYMSAYDMGLKGITYMRDGSRQGVLERVEEKKEEPKEVVQPQLPASPIKRRPSVLNGLTYKTNTPLGDAFITLNNDSGGDPFELFITIGKSGSDVSAMADALGRMVSLVLRLQSEVPPREKIRQIIAQLSGIGGARTVGFGENRVRSLPDAMAKLLADHFGFRVNGVVKDAGTREVIKNELQAINGQTNGLSKTHIQEASKETASANVKQEVAMQQLSFAHEPSTMNLFDLCPSCGGASLAHEEGCKKCYSCGYAEC